MKCIRVEGGGDEELEKDIPALLFVQLIAHVLGELLELTFGLCIVGIDHKILKVPKTPGEILEALALLEVGRYLGAYL